MKINKAGRLGPGGFTLAEVMTGIAIIGPPKDILHTGFIT